MAKGLANKARLMWHVLLCLVMGFMQLSAAPYSGCSPGTQRVVSYDNTLVPPMGVRSSSQDMKFNPDDYLFNRNNVPLKLWCSQSFEEATGERREGGVDLLFDNFNDNLTIHVNFSEPLLLTHLITSGFSNGYVNNFTVLHSLENEGPLTLYHYSDTQQEFTTDLLDAAFELKPPLEALRLRFDVNGGLMTPSGRLCWHLTLLGCTALEAANESSSVNHDEPPHSLTTTPPTQDSPTTATQRQTDSSGDRKEGETTSTATTAASDHKLLVLVVPIVSSAFVLMVCFVLCLCISMRHRAKRMRNRRQLSTEPIGSTDSLGMVDNELYKTRSSVFPMNVSAMARSAGSTATAHTGEALYENCSSVESNGFPGYKESGFYESIPQRTTELDQSEDSLTENPNYNIPFSLSYHPLDTTLEEETPTPPPLPMAHQRASSIDMVDNECYSVPPVSLEDNVNFEKHRGLDMLQRNSSCNDALPPNYSSLAL